VSSIAFAPCPNQAFDLGEISALEQDRDRAVVHRRDAHARSERSPLRPQPLAEAVVQRLGGLCRRRGRIAGPIAAGGVPIQGELADAEDLPVPEGLVHPSLGVVEDAQGPDLVGETIRVIVRVLATDPEQDQQARADLRDALALDIDGGLADPLNYGPQGRYRVVANRCQ
jgi:hypothetical protein